MKKHLLLIMISSIAMLIVSPVFAQAPPPLDPDPGAQLLAIVTNPSDTKLTVTTPGWEDGGDIPYEYTQYETNTFPGLTWTAGPATTQSYAIIMQDSGFVVRGSPILHWVLVNIPASVTELPAGMQPDAKPEGSIYGPNYRGVTQPYLGPRTPPGPKHRYHMQVLALDIVLPADFAPKNYDELMAPIKGHVVATGNVIGLGQAMPKE